jgi:hypothetical protein
MCILCNNGNEDLVYIPYDALESVKKSRDLDEEIKDILNIHTFNQTIWRNEDKKEKILDCFDNIFHITTKPLKLFHGGEISFEKMIFNEPVNYDYLATSYTEFIGMKFGRSCSGIKWMMEINVPIGTPIICLDEISYSNQFEHEILLDPRAEFSIKEKNDNYYLPEILEYNKPIIYLRCDYKRVIDKNIKLDNTCHFV